MIKLSFDLLFIFSLTAYAGRPGYPSETDFAQCLTGLSDLEPDFSSMIEIINGGDKNQITQELKNLVEDFRIAANNCGIELREGTGVANPRQCDQDIAIVGSILKEIINQCGKGQNEQNVFAVISAVMGMGNQLPRAIRDCGPLGQ